MLQNYLTDLANDALEEFAQTPMEVACDKYKIKIEVAPSPHQPKGLPPGRMAVYCFFRARQALKIGIAGPKSDARYRSQHYNPNSAQSTLAGSLLEYPDLIGIAPITPAHVGSWIKAHTSRVNILLPDSFGRPMLARLESFLHTKWQPTYEGFIPRNRH